MYVGPMYLFLGGARLTLL